MNAYLGAPLVIAFGLDGIERELDPGPPIDRDMYFQSDEQIAELAREVFGADLHEAYIDFKRAEWEDYHNTVSQWEWGRYLTSY